MIVVGENDTRPLDVVLKRNGVPIVLTGASVTFTMQAQSGDKRVTGDCSIETVEDPDTGADVTGPRYDWALNELDTPGLYRAQWRVTYPGGEEETIPVREPETIKVVAAV